MDQCVAGRKRLRREKRTTCEEEVSSKSTLKRYKLAKNVLGWHRRNWYFRIDLFNSIAYF